MDPLTQVALGAVAAQAISGAGGQRRAALAGGLGGLMPDADVFIRSTSDPLLFLEYHRHFTHALAFVPLGGVIAAVATWILGRRRWSLASLVLPATVGWSTHGLLDACTSYGTHLLWPFTNARVAWNVISIVDPIFTVLLLLGVWRAFNRNIPAPSRRWLCAAAVYLGLCSLQVARARAVYTEVLAARGHAPAAFEVRPSLGNNILYRAFYALGDELHVDAIRVPWTGGGTVTAGGAHPILDEASFARRYDLDALQREDLERFRFFSAGFLIEDPRFAGVVSDFRYAAVPDSVAPLWGVDFARLNPGEHARYRTFNRVAPQQRERFMNLLFGRADGHGTVR
ncbi:MAG: metal-dependent hydrolase [Planctomycetota bacterium]|nr:metal-dependent hydrolase [Planctomycetota bacterium]MDG1983416.1 metal-dependent hydrolase [Planctomycetota bacterium]